MCTWTCRSGSTDRRRSFRFRPDSEHVSLSAKSIQPTTFRGPIRSTCSSSSCDSAVVVVSAHDKQPLVGCGSMLLPMSVQSGIWKSYQNIKLMLNHNTIIRSPRPIRTEADAVKCATQFRLVFRVALQVAQLMHTVCELTFITVFAFASFFEWTAQFRLVAVWKEKLELY